MERIERNSGGGGGATLGEFLQGLPVLSSDQRTRNRASIVKRFDQDHGSPPLAQLVSIDFAAWRESLLAAGIQRATARKYVQVVRAVWRQASAAGLCGPPPTSPRPKKERSTVIPSSSWIPQRLALADVTGDAELAIVWSSCFPGAARDKQTRLALKDLAELLGRSPLVSDLTEATLGRFREHLAATQSGKTIKRRLSSLQRLRRALVEHGAEPIKPKAKRPRVKRPRQHLAHLGEDVPGTLAHFLRTTYAPARLRGASDNTMRLYGHTLRNFARYLKRPATVADLTEETVNGFLLHRAAERVSPRTVNKDRDQLCALWNFAARRRLVETFPDIQAVTEPRRTPKAWTVEELRSLFEAAGRVPGSISGVPASAWWQALLLVLWTTGERIGAILAASWDQVDGEWLTIPAESRKGRTADMSFRLPAEALQALERIREPVRDLIFPWDLAPTYLWSRFRTDVVRPAGLPCGRQSGFHRIRKSTASYLEAAGVSATRALGHADPKITRRYLDPRIVRGQQPADVLAELGRGGS